MGRIIAIDIGTSRIKCAAFDSDGIMHGLVSQRLDRASEPDTQDAEAWFAAVSRLLRELTGGEGRGADAVVLTGNMHALLGVDSHGTPVAPARLWSDNSASQESAELNARYGSMLSERYGNQSIPVFTLPKMLQMKRETPELYQRAVKFLQSKDFIAMRLTGQMATDPTDASGVLGMSLSDNSWDADFINDLQLDMSKLPDILPCTTTVGYVTTEASELTGLAKGTPVIIGSGDLASATLGSGTNAETLSLTLGTAGQLLAVGSLGDGAKLAGKLFVFAHANPSQELYLGSVPAGGFALEWMAKMHNLTMEQFFHLAQGIPLSPRLPVFLPYILGKGAPSMDYTPAGAWLELRADHTLAELCKAAIFGTLCPLRQCADLLERLTRKRSKVVLQALACRETPVRDCAAALFPQQKLMPAASEASLLGAAIIGFTALGAYPTIDNALAAMCSLHPLEAPPCPEAQNMFHHWLSCATNTIQENKHNGR